MFQTADQDPSRSDPPDSLQECYHVVQSSSEFHKAKKVLPEEIDVDILGRYFNPKTNKLYVTVSG